MALTEEDKLKIGSLLNQPRVYQNGIYSDSYAPGSTPSIAQRVQNWAGQTQPENAQRFGEEALGSHIRQSGFSANVAQTQDMADNLRRKYPNVPDDALMNFISTGKEPVVSQPTPQSTGMKTLQAGTTNAATPPAVNANQPATQQPATTQGEAPWETASKEYFAKFGWTPEQIDKLNTYRETRPNQGIVQPAQAGQRNAANPAQSVEAIRGTDLTRQSFAPGTLKDAYGNTFANVTTTDESGNVMTRQDQEQAKNMRIVQDIMERAGQGDRRAVQAIQALGGLRAAQTGVDALKDTATARRDNVASDLAPGLAASEIAYRNANAGKVGLESRLMGENNQLNQEYLKAQTWALRNPQLKTLRDPELERDRIATASADRALALDPTADWNAAYSRARNPVVSGRPGGREAAAAMLKQANPKATPEQIDAALKSRGY
jgi:hypothetical protein